MQGVQVRQTPSSRTERRMIRVGASARKRRDRRVRIRGQFFGVGGPIMIVPRGDNDTGRIAIEVPGANMRPAMSTRAPVESEKHQKCQGHITTSPLIVPWNNGPSRCGQKLCAARTRPSIRKSENEPHGVSSGRGRSGSREWGRMPVSNASLTAVTVAAPSGACQNPRVSQRTLVVQLPRARAPELKARLSQADFDFRPVPYALFSVKGEGVVATFYESGKLVVQGDNPELFVEHWIGTADAPSAARAPTSSQASPPAVDDDEAMIGSDECGKGDYFGPLVVAAVRTEPGQAAKLRAAGVRDSKQLNDAQCLKLGAALRGVFAHAVVRLDPPRYNQIYVQGKLNDLLANLHAEAIGQLARPGIHVLVDQFANAKVMEKKLSKLDVRLEQRTRAESNPAVAAASIIAREEFLTALKELSDAAAVDLHKGAGSPVDAAAERFVAIHGRAGLARVAKLHFKNTQKIRGGREATGG